MTAWQKRIVFPLLAFVLLVNGTYIVAANIQCLPAPIRGQVWDFSYKHLSLSPLNEPYGVYVNTPFGLTDSIAVVFYDDHENHVLIIHPGGDDHKLAAMQGIYNLRVNAPNDREAARLLREYLKKIGFRGSIRTALTFAHGAPGHPLLGRSPLGTDIFKLLSEYRPEGSYPDLAFVSCSVAAGEAGRQYLQHVADDYGLRVSASQKDIHWYFASKWFKSDEGKRNYEFVAEDWLTAVPHEKQLKRYSEVFSD